jgi:hypothetical protein
MTRRTHRTRISRRALIRGAAAGALALPFSGLLLPRQAHAQRGAVKRFVVFYFPDGVPGPSQNGDASLWHPTGGEFDFALPELLQPLAGRRDDCVFFRGLDMGRTDEGSHPGGAKKLLTNVDHGQGQSIDQFLAASAGADAPFRHVYLGVQSGAQGGSGDRFISYPSAGQSQPPEDDPLRAFNRLFTGGTVGGGGGGMTSRDLLERSVMDGIMADMNDLGARLGPTEKAKLDLHMDALREVERRLGGMQLDEPTQPPDASCSSPTLDSSGWDSSRAQDPALFPDIMRMQIDVLVQALACGVTRVGVLQGSYHTSELIMSRFVRPSGQSEDYDMRSHQASHYGAGHDRSRPEFSNFLIQRRWFVEQYAYMLDRLASLPDGEGSMLDTTAVLLCTEVCDGNTHSHSDMPFVLAGGSASFRTGRLHHANGARHGDLFAAIAAAMGVDVQGFGQSSGGPLGGLLRG